jgi:hypothetical protein
MPTAKRKNTKPSLDYYAPAGSSDDEPTVCHKFLRFDADNSGAISSVTTYHRAPASPVKGGSQPALAFFNDPIPEPDFMPTLMDDGTYLDPAYVDHLGDCVENPLGIKRARVQSVCTFLVWSQRPQFDFEFVIVLSGQSSPLLAAD